jgi:hypothetical protein
LLAAEIGLFLFILERCSASFVTRLPRCGKSQVIAAV